MTAPPDTPPTADVRRHLPRALRWLLLFVAYSTGLIACIYVAYLLRFDFQIPPAVFKNAVSILGGLVVVKLVLLLALGQFGSLLSYFGLHDLMKILLACAIAAALACCAWLFAGLEYAPPRAVILADLLLSFLFLTGFRLTLRMVRERFFTTPNPNGTRQRVAIIGAGDVGATLARDLLMRRGLGMKPVAFFDDARRKWGTTIHGVSVEGAPEELPDYLHRHKIDEVIIAMPSASGRRIREIVTLLNQLHLRFEIVPSYEQILNLHRSNL